MSKITSCNAEGEKCHRKHQCQRFELYLGLKDKKKKYSKVNPLECLHESYIADKIKMKYSLFIDKNN